MIRHSNNKFLADVQAKIPDVVTFGECHAASSSFRSFCFDQLPSLQSLGFSVLALELTPDLEDPLHRYCQGRLWYPDLLKIMRQGREKSFINSIDRRYVDAVSAWVNN